jgi:uncharacterized protein (TIGR02147 family)
LGALKSIFQYEDYREFLKEYYAFSKETNPKFSYRYFSRLAGFKSSSVLKEVMDAKINIDPSAIVNYIRVLKFNKEEGEFFRNLVLFNQAKTSDQKQLHARELLKSRTYRKLHPVSAAQFAYLSHWYYVPVRELIAMKSFKEDAHWIAGQISPTITPAEAKRAVQELVKLNLVKRDESDKLVQVESNLSVGQGPVSAFIARWHKEMLKKASESIDRHARELRDISTATVTISDKTLETVKEIVKRCRREIMEVASNDPGPNLIYQVNFQLFPLSRKIEDESEGSE